MKTLIKFPVLFILMTLLIHSNDAIAQNYVRRSSGIGQKEEKAKKEMPARRSEVEKQKNAPQRDRREALQRKEVKKEAPKQKEVRREEPRRNEVRRDEPRRNEERREPPQRKEVRREAPQRNEVRKEAPRHRESPARYFSSTRHRPPHWMPRFRPAPRDYYYGHRLRHLPRTARRYDYGGTGYYYLDGFYYRLIDGYYCLTRPPVGTILDMAAVSALKALTVAMINTTDDRYNAAEQIYYDDGIFFVLDKNGEYLVIDPPIGTKVPYLPDDYEKVRYDGETLYKVEQVLFQKIYYKGEIFYEVVGLLAIE